MTRKEADNLAFLLAESRKELHPSLIEDILSISDKLQEEYDFYCKSFDNDAEIEEELNNAMHNKFGHLGVLHRGCTSEVMSEMHNKIKTRKGMV